MYATIEGFIGLDPANGNARILKRMFIQNWRKSSKLQKPGILLSLCGPMKNRLVENRISLYQNAAVREIEGGAKINKGNTAQS